MANEARKADMELDDLAFKIYAQRVAAGPVKGGGEREAKTAYQRARAFLEVRDAVRSGALEVAAPAGPQLADCCAPNLPPTHPLNLVSQTYGDLAKVRRIHDWLEKNPTPEKDTEELVARFRRAFSDVSWGKDHAEALATINTARAVFPAYCKN